MTTRRVESVQFNGEASELHALIGCWNAIKGVQWSVTATDYVGGSFDVMFSRQASPISQVEAQTWVDVALKHARD